MISSNVGFYKVGLLYRKLQTKNIEHNIRV